MNTNPKQLPTRTRRQSGISHKPNRFSSLSGSARRWIDIEDFDVEPANDPSVDERQQTARQVRGLFFRIPDTF